MCGRQASCKNRGMAAGILHRACVAGTLYLFEINRKICINTFWWTAPGRSRTKILTDRDHGTSSREVPAGPTGQHAGNTWRTIAGQGRQKTRATAMSRRPRFPVYETVPSRRSVSGQGQGPGQERRTGPDSTCPCAVRGPYRQRSTSPSACGLPLRGRQATPARGVVPVCAVRGPAADVSLRACPAPAACHEAQSLRAAGPGAGGRHRRAAPVLRS